MSQAEELLAELTEEVPVHTHPVTDSDTYFIIDPITKKITNTANRKNILMQFDHNSEVFTFELPRYVEGHDMLLCDTVYIHWNNIDGKTAEENADTHEATNFQVNPENEDTVICTWKIKKQSTLLAGILSFLLEYVCHDEEGNEVYSWHSDFYDDIEIRKGRDNGNAIAIEYSDLLEEWYKKLFGNGESGTGIKVTGKVGQIIKIAKVDDTGVPTAWEAVDMPETVTDDHINELIDAALGEIVNGEY